MQSQRAKTAPIAIATHVHSAHSWRETSYICYRPIIAAARGLSITINRSNPLAHSPRLIAQDPPTQDASLKLLIPIIRTGIIAAAVVITGLLTLRAFTDHELQKTNEALERMNADLQKRIEVREKMIDRLTRSRRLAHLQISDQTIDSSGKIASTDLNFIELDDDGSELARQSFTLPGDVIYVDAWTIKFSHDLVAAGDPLAGHTLVLLRRMYSDKLAPADGPEIDTPGAVPPAYAVSDAGKFEQQVWKQFWSIATDSKLATSLGVRVAQGEAVYKRVRTGQTFELIVDAAGGMSLTPIDPDVSLSFVDGPAKGDK